MTLFSRWSKIALYADTIMLYRIRQYRTRISQWGKDKNIKPVEMTAIVRKRQQRKLVEIDKGELIFTIRGSTVESQKIDRWMNRHRVPENLLYAPSPAACKCDGYCLHTTADMLKPPHPLCAVELFPNAVPRSLAPHTQHKLRTSRRKALYRSPRVLRFSLLPSPYRA